MRKIYLSLSFIRGYVSVASFLLCVLGLTGICFGILVKQYKYLEEIAMFTQGTTIYQVILSFSFTVGSCLIMTGFLGLIGVFANKKKVLIVYNIINIIFFLTALAMGIISQVYSNPLKEGNCQTNGWAKSYNQLTQAAYSSFCQEGCKCNLNIDLINRFSLQNQTIIANNIDPNGPTSFQGCPQYQKVEAQIPNINEVITTLQTLENKYLCSGFCNNGELDVYYFTNVNRGPPIFPQGCYDLISERWQVTNLKFEIISWMIMSILLINSFILALHLKQDDRRSSSIIQKMTFF